jgi:hypothetical protein
VGRDLLGHDGVHDAVRQQVRRAHPLPGGHLCSPVRAAVQDRACPFRRQRCEPGVARGDHPAGRQQGERSAAGSLAEQYGHRRDGELDHLGDAAGDLTGQGALLRGGGQLRAWRVDDADQGQPQLVCHPHPAARGAQRGGPERSATGLGEPVLADQHAGCAREGGQRQDQRVAGLPGLGAAERQDVVRGVPQQFADARPVPSAGQGDRGPGVRPWRRGYRLRLLR